MPTFIPKKIAQLVNMGEELRQARNEKKLSIEEVAKMIQIRKEYLLALESENLNALPSGMYCKNFLKKYSQFLQIPPRRIDLFLKQLDEDFVKDDPFSQKIINKKEFLVFPKIVRNIILGLIFLVFIFYLGFYFRNITTPPNLQITNPVQNVMLSDNKITLQGVTDPGAEITINREMVLTDKNGNFQKDISLKKGLNTLEIIAKKKYSRENIVIRQIIVE
jgi:cytoskeletal protein RodZ